MSHAILTAARTHITGLEATDDATILDLVPELLQGFDDLGAEGLDRVLAANADLDPDDLDRLFHLAMIAKHGDRADAVTVEALGATAFRSALANTPQE